MPVLKDSRNINTFLIDLISYSTEDWLTCKMLLNKENKIVKACGEYLIAYEVVYLIEELNMYLKNNQNEIEETFIEPHFEISIQRLTKELHEVNIVLRTQIAYENGEIPMNNPYEHRLKLQVTTSTLQTFVEDLEKAFAKIK